MNYIVISPYYPQNFQQFTVELANKGITVLGIGQEPYDQLDQPLKDSLTEYFRVENLENLDEVKRAVAFLFYKHGPIDRIESHNEYWLELDAELREQFNVFGAKPKDLKKTKFKSEMKKLFKKAGVPEHALLLFSYNSFKVVKTTLAQKVCEISILVSKTSLSNGLTGFSL